MKIPRSVDLLPIGAPLSARAATVIARHYGRRLPGCTGSREELEALLHQRGAPTFEAVFAFERTFGGLFGHFLELGAVAIHRDSRNEYFWHETKENGAPLIAVGRDAHGPYFLDERGALYGLARDDEHPTWRSVSAAGLIEKLALLDEARASGRAALQVELDVPCAEVIAIALGVPCDPDASDLVHAIWQGAEMTVLTGRLRDGALEPGAKGTVLLTRTIGCAVEALRAAARSVPSVRARITPAQRTESTVPPAAAPHPRPPELCADPSAIELAYIPLHDGESGSVWARGGGPDARIDQLVTFRDRVLGWDRLSDTACETLHFTAASLAGLVTDRALLWIEASQGRRDPRATCLRPELERMLAARGAPVSQVLLDFEDQFGGLELTFGEPFSFGLLSGLACRNAPAVLVHGGIRLVPIGTHGDTTYLMDERGAVYTQPFEGETKRVAESASDFFDDLAGCLGDAPSSER